MARAMPRSSDLLQVFLLRPGPGLLPQTRAMPLPSDLRAMPPPSDQGYASSLRSGHGLLPQTRVMPPPSDQGYASSLRPGHGLLPQTRAKPFPSDHGHASSLRPGPCLLPQSRAMSPCWACLVSLPSWLPYHPFSPSPTVILPLPWKQAVWSW